MLNIQEPKVILDIRGLVLHAAHRGDDPNGTKNEKGKVEPTAEYAFDSFLETYMVPLMEEHAPRNIIAVWDGGSEFRKGIFPTYKKKRGERVTSDFLKEQLDTLMQRAKQFLAGMGCLQCSVEGVEADDVIALLVDKLPHYCLVYTVDADLGVLTSDTCRVFLKNDPMMTHYVYKSGSGDSKRETLVPLRFVSLFKSLIGDSSDEYPGVKGFGPAAWTDMVKVIGEDGLTQLEDCVARMNFSALQEAVEEDPLIPSLAKLYEARYEWGLQYGLARMHPELCSGAKNGKLVKIKWHKRVPDKDRVYQLMAWGNTLDMWPKFEPHMITMTLVTKDNLQQAVDHFVDNVAKAPVCSFDYESYDVLNHQPFQEAKSKGIHVDVLSQGITGCSFSYGPNLQHTIYLSSDHTDTDNIDDMMIWEFMDEAKTQGVALVAQNAPFEIALTDTNFEKDVGRVIDTRIMSVYVDENSEHHLKMLSKKHLNYQQATYKETLHVAAVENMQQLTGEQVLKYGCDDSICTSALFDLFYIILQVEGTWDFLAYEFDTNSTLYEGFESGLEIDFDRMKVLQAEDQKIITEDTASMRELLAENCSRQNPKGAETLQAELAEYVSAKMRMDNKSEEEIATKLASLWETTLASSKYYPLVVTKKGPEFKPTKLQFNKVITALGLDLPLPGVSASKINAWAFEAKTDLVLQTGQAAFVDALIDATPHLKKREGAEYDLLVKLCNHIMSAEAKEETIGDQLNFDSPTQMQQLLYAKLGLPIRRRSNVTPNSSRDKLGMKGAPATSDKAVDTALAEDVHPGSWKETVLKSMKAIKGSMTCFKYYYVPYPKWVHPRDGRVHAGTTNCGTVTRRFTGSDPNPYQLSKKRKGRIRTMVLPKKKGHVILSPDLNGEELRITASLAKDPVMIDAYIGQHRKDLHSLTASAITPIMLPRLNAEYAGTEEVTYEEFVEALKDESDTDLSGCLGEIRGLAKGVNFLILYVGGASTLSINLGVPEDVAQEFINAVLKQYPRLKAWQDESIEFAREHGYVLTSYGNLRHLGDGLYSEEAYIRTKHERQAVNSQVQGTGSDIMKVILAEMHRQKTLRRLDGSLIVPPYDEVAVSVPLENAWECWLQMRDIMTITPPGNAVPQLPELKASALNWGTCIEMGADPTEDLFNEIMARQLAERKAA